MANEVKNLPAAVLLLVVVGVLVGVGVLILDSFGDAVKEDATTLHENVSVSEAGLGQLVNDEVLVLSSCYDESNETQLTVPDECNVTNLEAGELLVATSILRSSTVLANYTYSADSFTTDTLDFARDAVGDIAEDWLVLIVTIMVLALILGLVMAGFAGESR